jgi:hypothetical protein
MRRLLIGDPDYTFLAMTRFADGLKQFWGKIFGMVEPTEYAHHRAKKYEN